MPNTIVTRPAQREDLPQISAMIEQLANHHDDTAVVDIEVLSDLIFEQHPWVFASVATLRQKPIGYVVTCPLIQLQWSQKGVDIHHLFVDAAHRGQGVGKQLVRTAIEDAKTRGCTYVTIGTAHDNTAAQAAYQAMGFTQLAAPGPRFRIRVDGPLSNGN
ncbi:GNAT family N-acetyltransferase [Cochlodiniinecator piscidefendens]|uniref:GNAT family N-acetyltransferase n=1 Tax=Cochlodiniinecator piscidefendens TaxID=2715756 RepID=UPI001408EBD1|nr:GNAT family N-acetyltransferase [Cochlodiniinecator piscidefendens]